MKKLLLGLSVWMLAVFISAQAMAEVDVKVRVDVPLPPPIIFPAPPHVIVIPHTDVYSVPDVEEDIFFYGGWWWRPWHGHWYRSRHYDRGFQYFEGRPPFHRQVPPGWRKAYHDRRWNGHEWDFRPIPHGDAEKNWKNWKKNKHWEKHNNWGLRGPEGRSEPGMRQGKPDDRPGQGPGRRHDKGPKDHPGRGHDRGPHDGPGRDR
jgi:hypothetical protein